MDWHVKQTGLSLPRIVAASQDATP